MYIRTKTRTNKSNNTYAYAYLAQIRRKKSRPKQKILKYLGRIYIAQKIGTKQPEITLDSPLRDIFSSLLKTELENHGFKETVPLSLRNWDLEVNLGNITVSNLKTGKKVCIQLNQGILCEETLKNLVEYSIPQENLKGIRQHFAKTIVEAGIQAPETVMVQIFQKIQTMINTKQCQTMPNNAKHTRKDIKKSV